MRQLSPYNGTKLFQMKTSERYQSHLTEMNEHFGQPRATLPSSVQSEVVLAQNRNRQKMGQYRERRNKPAALCSATLDKGRGDTQWRETASSRNGARKAHSCVQTPEIGTFPNDYTKIDSKGPGAKCEWVQPLRTPVWEFLRKLKTQLPLIHEPATPLLGMYVQTEV